MKNSTTLTVNIPTSKGFIPNEKKPKKMKEAVKLAIVFTVSVLVILTYGYINSYNTAQKAIGTTETSYIDRGVNPAYNQMYRDIRWNESREADSLVNEVGATGHLQYTTSRVDAINETFGTDYVLSDFLDAKLSYRVFIKVQLLRNPQADWEFGIRDWATPSNHYAPLTSARMEVIRNRDRR